jgi:hypothetical protein
LVCICAGIAGALGLALVRAEAPVPTSAEAAAFFDKEVKPILTAHCFACHGGEKTRGGLKLLSREDLLKGGDNGPVVDLQKPGVSRLVQAINHGEDLKMPPKGKLPQAQIDVLTQWVKMGVPWGAPTTTVRHGPPPVDDRARAFWAFKPVVRPAVPIVKNADWVRTPIDAFILAKLEEKGLQPAPPAERGMLIRRLTYDLTGLPPTEAEVDAFVRDTSAEAYERLVDRLLVSPHYGERWARHWLDLVRYAESNSFERDNSKPFVWRYRDYVIRAFNDDKPYDRFIKEQIAGDELPGPTADGLIATGYYRLGPWDDEPVDALAALYDGLDDIVSTTGQVFLGLTVGCARCHDHKIDPMPQKDYYRFLAFFNGIRHYGVRSNESVAEASLRPISTPDEQAGQQSRLTEHTKKEEAARAEMARIENEVKDRLTPIEKEEFQYQDRRVGILRANVPKLLSQETLDRYVALRKDLADLVKRRPIGLAQALCVTEIGHTPRETFVLQRGNPRVHGDKVAPGFPSVLTTQEPKLNTPAKDAKTSGQRTVLAEWLASADNPLTARVIVNRVWQHHFGRGIVRSTSNFGYQGTPPTHPELLDWLASEFAASGWRFKTLHKMILMSSAYRMSSKGDATALAKDPENDLFWRFNMRRLSAEEVRDSILAASGNLNTWKMNGPSIYPVIPAEVLAGQSMPGAGWGKSSPEDVNRRSVYVHIKRSLGVPILVAFDAADPDATCPVRFTTTQPTQALGLLNSAFLNDQAKVFAESARSEAGPDTAAQVRLVLRRATQRSPAAAEVERGVRFMQAVRELHKQSADEALRSFCLLALNLNEFVYLD